MTEKTYEEGVRDGRILSLENNQQEHSKRLDKLEDTMRTQERITYGLLGIIAFIQLWPTLERLFP